MVPILQMRKLSPKCETIFHKSVVEAGCKRVDTHSWDLILTWHVPLTSGVWGQQSVGAQRLAKGEGFVVRRTRVQNLAWPYVIRSNLPHLFAYQFSPL